MKTPALPAILLVLCQAIVSRADGPGPGIFAGPTVDAEVVGQGKCYYPLSASDKLDEVAGGCYIQYDWSEPDGSQKRDRYQFVVPCSKQSPCPKELADGSFPKKKKTPWAQLPSCTYKFNMQPVRAARALAKGAEATDKDAVQKAGLEAIKAQHDPDMESSFAECTEPSGLKFRGQQPGKPWSEKRKRKYGKGAVDDGDKRQRKGGGEGDQSAAEGEATTQPEGAA